MNFVQNLYLRARHAMTRRIWQSDMLADRSWRGRLSAVLRVISMTWTGINENHLPSRAAALSYSSMLGLGPLVAIVVMVSGSMLEERDTAQLVEPIKRALEFIAPQLRQLTPDPGTGETVTVNPEVLNLLNTVIAGTQSKAIGIMGALALIFIVVQLFSSIENAFNDVWGVRRGRNWVLRIVFYWAAVTLGAVLTFASLTLLSASTLINTLETLPMGAELRRFFEFFAPLISLGVLTCLGTVFYKFIPNTSVRWRAAMVGAVVAVALLYLNNFLAFLYLKRVVLNQSLYGSLGLLPILMLGLFVFWLFLLLGGQITYAVQNAQYRSSHLAWHDLNHTSRQGVTLLVFTLIARRFRECQPPYEASELADLTRIPTQIVNACLTRLIQLNLISGLPPEDGNAGLDYRFQPARPLDRLTLAEFKESIEGYGQGPQQADLDARDPVVRQFHTRLQRATAEALGHETFEAVIARLTDSRPASQTETVGTIHAGRSPAG
jgi:membrane protein